MSFIQLKKENICLAHINGMRMHQTEPLIEYHERLRGFLLDYEKLNPDEKKDLDDWLHSAYIRQFGRNK